MMLIFIIEMDMAAWVVALLGWVWLHQCLDMVWVSLTKEQKTQTNKQPLPPKKQNKTKQNKKTNSNKKLPSIIYKKDAV